MKQLKLYFLLLLSTCALGINAQGFVNEGDNGIIADTRVKPEFVGGSQALYEFINANMVYPADAQAQKLQGDVEIYFWVKADGTIYNVTVKKGVCPSIDAEAIRIVNSMPKWKPGKVGINTVAMQAALIIGFKLR